MVTCIDGPAKGQEFAIRRVPKYLRVVCSPNGRWDVLDQLDDEPRPKEKIYVYVRRDDLPQSKFHIRARRRSESGFYFTCSYSFLPEQPKDTDVRTTFMWQEWASKQSSTMPLFDMSPDA
jgi:hypothetical protein